VQQHHRRTLARVVDVQRHRTAHRNRPQPVLASANQAPRARDAFLVSALHCTGERVDLLLLLADLSRQVRDLEQEGIDRAAPIHGHRTSPMVSNEGASRARR
jgi:uncharacterized membrane protein